MSVIANIKGKIKYNDLVSNDVDYGVRDNTYRLFKGTEDANIVVFYNNNTIGRGIEVERLPKSIELKLASSSTRDDIRLFYDLIDRICKENKQDKFSIEGEIHKISEINDLKEAELKNAHSTFDTLVFLLKTQGGRIAIFGARNPIDLDLGLLKQLDFNYDKYEKYICDIQHIDAHYASPVVMSDKKGKYQGVFTMGIGRYIYPIEPELNYADVPEDLEIDKWYIGNEKGIIKYEDFANYFKDSSLYDANHLVVELTEEKMKELFDRFSIDPKSI